MRQKDVHSLATSSQLQSLRASVQSRPRSSPLHRSPEQARAELTAHLQAGAADLQRLFDLLAHRKEGEAPRG
jgi:hypothetical protein